jgi:hypothetical protein
MFLRHFTLNFQSKLVEGHLHLPQQRDNIHPGAARQSGEKQSFGTGSSILASELLIGINHEMMAVQLDIEGHIFCPAYYRVVSHSFLLRLPLQGVFDFRLVESYDNLPVNINDWYTHLTGFADHLFRFSLIRRYIVLRKGDMVLLEVLLCFHTISAGWG